ncbi:hypothetical protein J4210_02265 [Candidatus Woesearchaeota archaeon]|nr:hypothetical protein [Candidatus Woesearchaeota archaeon]
MKRLLLDTNIYGEIIIDRELDLLISSYRKNHHNLIYGFSFIRKELRATPKTKKYGPRNLRVALLSLYDLIVGKHSLVVDETKLKSIAEKYYGMYRELGGSFGKEELMSDFIIVACASLKKMDIVVSEDDSTMLSELSLKAYSLVNKVLTLENPEFYGYVKLKELLLRA